MKIIYLDYAATSPLDKLVFEAMKPYLLKYYGNSSEPHFLGAQSKKALEEAREKVAEFLHAKLQEIVFTSCATESINLSHKGLIESVAQVRHIIPHIITSSVEHKAVLATCQHLEQQGLAKVSYLNVDKYGLINLKDLEKEIKPETVLVSIMYVNNEVGTIQPLSEIKKLLEKVNLSRGHKIYFHTDATQGVQYLNCNVNDLGVDLLSLTGHKFGAPKGIGALFVRSGTPLCCQIDGGSQERNYRSGTENVPSIVGLGKAIELVAEQKLMQVKKTTLLRDKLIEKVLQIPQVYLTGHSNLRSPHIASFIIEGIEGETLVLYLSNQGIIVSSGSACTSKSLQPSHVLTAMGIPAELSHGSLRISLGKNTTEEDITTLIKVLPQVVTRVRSMAPKI